MNAPERIHFVGIGGIHMSGLAGILLSDGARVSGSDLSDSHLIEKLRARGADIALGHDAANVEGADLVVRTVAVQDDNAEIIAARQAGIEVITRAQMVARLAGERTTLTVAGSHGKTTTATMLTLIMREAGLDPSFILGGESRDLETHAARGGGTQIVLEADEYGRAFLEYQPSIAVITNIERDHLDYYGSFEALQEAFAAYAATLQLGGTLIVGAESGCVRSLVARVIAARTDLTMETFGLGAEFDWSSTQLREDERGVEFAVRHAATDLGVVRLQVPGEHNVRNALAAIAAASVGGADFASAQRALAAFRGVQRRFQLHGEAEGVVVLDDYAHHPTEISATMAAARTRYPGRRLVVLFQPHTYSRSAYLLEGFIDCFHDVDRLFLTDTYAAREDPSQGLSAVDLAAQISRPGAIYVGSLDEAVNRVGAALKPGDVVITMGAGDVDRAGRLLLEGLRAQ